MIHPSIEMIKRVAQAFEKMGEGVLFVGGSVVPLYVPEHFWHGVRPTKDVDGVVEVSSHQAYAQLERKLERAGFQHDMSEGAPICRWLYESFLVDVMPDEESVLGFSSRWYKEGGAAAELRELESGCTIRILPRAYYLASKIEAFNSRGKNDYLGSADIEDIICILDGCTEKGLQEILKAPGTVLEFLSGSFAGYIREAAFLECIGGHVEYGMTHDDRVKEIKRKISVIGSIR